jgi:DNA mismatch repair ATPase MutS
MNNNNDKNNQIFEINENSSEFINEINKIINDHYYDNKNDNKNDEINVNDNVYTDTKICDYFKDLCITVGGSKLIEKILKKPLNNKELLLKRQQTNYLINNTAKEILKNNEKDLLWIMILEKELKEELTINLLFFSGFVIKNLNHYNFILSIYHLYKIIIIPLISLSYPITIIYGPYFYINKYTPFKMDIYKYLNIIYEFIKLIFKFSGNIKIDITKIITVFLYLFLYIYALYQSLYNCYILYKTREKLLNKLDGLYKFIKTSLNIIKHSNNIWKPFIIFSSLTDDKIDMSIQRLDKLKNNFSTVYKLWKDENYKTDIINILKVIYTLDVINTISNLKKNKNWCLPTYDDTNTQIFNVNNPLLSSNQISNPVNLSKSIIITGVNAGGKTTYVKSITINIILAQTIGIINALKGNIYLYDAIITFMRISDTLGKNSYFEAETELCNSMIEIAEDLNKKGKRGLFIMDEPMHSTPPIEGISVAYSVAEYLAKLKGMTLIITTHFHHLIELEENYKSLFINLSFLAQYNDKTKTYDFNYKINRGGTKQIIAIELLEKKKFNKEIIKSAIELKNKLYI